MASDRAYYDMFKEDTYENELKTFKLTVWDGGLKFYGDAFIPDIEFTYTNFSDESDDYLQIAGYAAEGNEIATVSFWYGSHQPHALLSYSKNSDVWATLLKSWCYRQ